MRRNDQRKRLNSQKTIPKLPPVNKKSPQPQKIAQLGKISHQDQGIISLLYEYLIKNNFLETLESFQKDCTEKGIKPNNKIVQAFKQELIQSFEQGLRESFFNRFSQFVPISMRSRNIQTMKLQFCLQVYFYVYSIHPQLGRKRTIDSNAKQAFIGYLEGRGATLAKSAQFSQYYALVHLPKPQEHPKFKNIFTRQWIGELKKQFVYFTQKLYPVGQNPAIVAIYDRFIQKNLGKSEEFSQQQDPQEFQIQQEIEEQSQNFVPIKPLTNRGSNNAFQTDRQRQSLNLKIAELEQQKIQLVKFIENFKNKYQSLQNKYKDFTSAAENTLMQSQTKWFKITQQFYNIANTLLQVCNKYSNAMPTQDINTVQKIGKKLQKYDSFIHMNIQDLISENVDFSMFQRPDYDISTDLARKNTATQNYYRPQNMIQIDFQKIKKTLLSNKPQLDSQKCDIIQALKWRVIKTRGILTKRQAVLSLVLNDIFNFSEGQNVIQFLFRPENNPEVVLRVAQLLNALSKDYYGREYLTRQKVIKQTLSVLYSQQTNENIKSFIILTLQQLSIKTKAQLYIIQGQLIKYIIQKLNRERQTMPEYLMQYSTALLINLLLRKQGNAKAQQIKQQILMTLINLMQVQSTQVRQYVHGTLYPLFAKKSFRDKAKQYGMQQNIQYLLQNAEAQSIILQLNHLQKQLKREDDQDQTEDNNQEDQEQDTDDIYDQEYGEDFKIQSDNDGRIDGRLAGEDLLLKKYTLTGPEAINQLNAIREESENTLKKKSVYMANSFSDRPGTNNPVLQMRRNASHNNSVYSNKSSNRFLRSELNNRSQIVQQNRNQNQSLAVGGGGHSTSSYIREKLDTVQPDNSDKEMSMKDFINQNHDKLNDIQVNERNRQLFSAGKMRNGDRQKITGNRVGSQSGKRGQNSSRVIGSKQQSRRQQNQNIPQNNSKRRYDHDSRVLYNQSFSQSKIQAQNQKKPRTYEQTQEYRQAFGTKQRITRTPPSDK